MKFLAVDYGRKRIGLAVSDEMASWATPYATRQRLGRVRDSQDIVDTARGLGVQGIVFGLPRAASGESGELEGEVRSLAQAVEQQVQQAGLQLQIEWWDERFSTAEAEKGMRAAGISQREGRESSGSSSIDARAAAVILQGFLDRRQASNLECA